MSQDKSLLHQPLNQSQAYSFFSAVTISVTIAVTVLVVTVVIKSNQRTLIV